MLRTRYQISLLLICVLLLISATAHADILTQMGQHYHSASLAWFPKLLAIAKSLFWKLAAIEFAWSAFLWVLKYQEMQSFTAALVQKIMGIGFFYALLENADSWIPAIINSFIHAGSLASGLPKLTPSEIFDVGIDTAVTLLNNLHRLSVWDDLATMIIGGLASLLIVISFLIVACQMLVALIESYIVIGGGVLFLGMGGSRWTIEFTQKYLGYAFAVGVKLFVLYLITGIGLVQAKTWSSTLNTLTWENIFIVLGSSLMLAALNFHLPTLASSFLSGSPALTLGNMGAAATGVAVGTAALGSAALSPVAKAAKGGLSTVSGGYQFHRAAGEDRVMSAVKGLGTASQDIAQKTMQKMASSVGWQTASSFKNGHPGTASHNARSTQGAQTKSPTSSNRMSPINTVGKDTPPSAHVNIPMQHSDD